MKVTLRATVVCLALSTTATFALAQGDPIRTVMLTPGELAWVDRGAIGHTALIVGDPTKSGMYAVLLRMRSGLRVEPHSHPDNRVATILSGTFYVG
jgi:hypothetical protein